MPRGIRLPSNVSNARPTYWAAFNNYDVASGGNRGGARGGPCEERRQSRILWFSDSVLVPNGNVTGSVSAARPEPSQEAEHIWSTLFGYCALYTAHINQLSSGAAAAAALTIAWNGASDTRRETCVKSSARHDKIRLPVSLSVCVPVVHHLPAWFLFQFLLYFIFVCLPTQKVWNCRLLRGDCRGVRGWNWGCCR